MLAQPTVNKAMEEPGITRPAASPAHLPISHENRKPRLTTIRATMKCRWPAVPPPGKYVHRTKSWRIDHAHSCHYPPEKSVPELRLQINEVGFSPRHWWIRLPGRKSKSGTHAARTP